MRISARCEYACRALLGLSLYWPAKSPVHIRELAKSQNIPIRYLVQILIHLKRMGFVTSIRGKEGGYYLAVPPRNISLGKVVREMGGPLISMAQSRFGKKRVDIFSEIWHEAEGAVAQIVDRVTFEDICHKARGAEKAIFYEI